MINFSNTCAILSLYGVALDDLHWWHNEHKLSPTTRVIRPIADWTKTFHSMYHSDLDLSIYRSFNVNPIIKIKWHYYDWHAAFIKASLIPLVSMFYSLLPPPLSANVCRFSQTRTLFNLCDWPLSLWLWMILHLYLIYNISLAQSIMKFSNYICIGYNSLKQAYEGEQQDTVNSHTMIVINYQKQFNTSELFVVSALKCVPFLCE